MCQAPLALATEGIFFNISSARKLAADLDYLKKSNVNDSKMILELNKVNQDLFLRGQTLEIKTKYLEDDKTLLKARGDNFEKEYNKCTNQLNSCIENKPSRMVWYGAGVITTLVLGLATLFLTNR